jgi:hypothetical protein
MEPLVDSREEDRTTSSWATLVFTVEVACSQGEARVRTERRAAFLPGICNRPPWQMWDPAYQGLACLLQLQFYSSYSMTDLQN